MAYISFQPKDYFNTKLYTGDGEPAGNAITGVGFQPDWVWIKERSSSNAHLLFDAVRGVTKSISSNLTSAEVTDAQYLTTFGTDGFTVGPSNDINEPSSTYASWNWKANGQGSSNTDGSINTTYTSVNTTAGFSISKYTGTGSNATIGTGLGAIPHMAIFKRTDTSGFNWFVYHRSLGAGKFIILDTTGAEQSSTSIWQNTTPTSSVITLGGDGGVNASGGTYIAYCFSQKSGFSSMGSYTGNGNADGVYQHLGFSASWLMIKRTDSTASWVIFDNKRLGYNVANYQLYANSTSGEGNNVLLDITSQGFKCRANHLDVNGSGATYIYMAFAEAPLVSSNGVPAVAR